MGLCFYFSGIIIILILDYLSEIIIFKEKITEIAYAALDLLIGGIGFDLFIESFLMKFPFLINCNHCFGISLGILLLPIGGFVYFGGFLYNLFFWDIVSKACRIAFPFCYFCCFGFFLILL